jgi:hypothetical protein
MWLRLQVRFLRWLTRRDGYVPGWLWEWALARRVSLWARGCRSW